MRLNNQHRANILSNIMTEWDRTNPAPEKNAKRVFVLEFINLMQTSVLKSVSKAQQEFNEIIRESASAVEYRKSLREQTAAGFRMSVADNWSIKIMDGKEVLDSVEFTIPVEIAKDLGLTYFSESSDSYNIASDATFPEYAEKRNYGGYYVKTAAFVEKEYQMTLKLPSKEKCYTDYVAAKAAYDEWQAVRREIVMEFTDYLAEFNTTNQVREAWSELVPFLPGHLADPEAVIRLPGIRVSKLAERLALNKP